MRKQAWGLWTGIVLSVLGCRRGLAPGTSDGASTTGLDGGASEAPSSTTGSEDSVGAVRSCAEVEEYLVRNQAEELLQEYYGQTGDPNAPPRLECEAPPAIRKGATMAPSETPGSQKAPSQIEPDVIEPDAFADDGEFLYAVYERGIVVIKKQPLEVVARVELEPLEDRGNGSFSFHSVTRLFLLGDRLVVPSRNTRIHVLDISVPTEPVLERVLDVEGQIVDARQVGASIYFLFGNSLNIGVNAWDLLDLDVPPYEFDASEARRAELREQARGAVEAYLREMVPNVEEAIPTYAFDGGMAMPLFSCGDIHLPGTAAGLDEFSVMRFDPTSGEAPSAIAAIGEVYRVYADGESLFVHGSVLHRSGDDATSSDTHVHRFSVDGDLRYLGDAELAGEIGGPFALSSRSGYLRVVTSDARRSDGQGNLLPGEHRLTVLDLSDRLERVATLPLLSSEENITATRFVEDRLYVASDTDSRLDVVDVSEPTEPVVTGRLEATSARLLFPLGQDRLLVMGRAPTGAAPPEEEDPLATGGDVELSLFDRGTGERLASRVLAGTEQLDWHVETSDENDDHLRFTFSPGQGSVSFPLNPVNGNAPLLGTTPCAGNEAGLAVFSLDPSSFELQTCISHDALLDQTGGPVRSPFERGIADPERFYAVSSAQLTVHDAVTFELLENIPLDGGGYGISEE